MRDFDVRMLRTLAWAVAVGMVSGAVAHAQEGQQAQGGQFVLIDATFTATALNTKSSEYGVAPLPAAPRNWRTPIDYSAGSIHVRVEVLEKPSMLKTLCNVCLFAADTLTCMPYPPPYTKPGVYESEPKIRTFWQYDVYDWTEQVERVNVVVKDENGRFVQGNSAFFPTKLHVTVTVIPPGGRYVAPAQAGGPLEGDDDADAGVRPAVDPVRPPTITPPTASNAGAAGVPPLDARREARAATAGAAGFGARGSAASFPAVAGAGTPRDIREYIDPGSSCAALRVRPKSRYGVAVSIALSFWQIARIWRRKRRLRRSIRSQGRRR